MSEIIHTRQDEENGDSLGDEDSFLRGITVSFSWDYPDDYSLRDVQNCVFFAYDEINKPSSESQYICDCLQEAETGVTLLRPHPPSPLATMGRSIASEIHFKPDNDNNGRRCEFLFKKITVVSESRHLELYIDDVYEMTSKGCAVTLKKGSKPAFYENHFEIPDHFESSQKLSLKFLSLGERNTMRLQAIIIKVAQQQQQQQQQHILQGMSSSSSFPFPLNTQNLPSMPATGSGLDIGGVRDMLQSMGLSVPSEANKLMSDIEHQQKQLQMTQLQGLANVGLMAQLQTVTHQQQALQQQNQSMQFLQAFLGGGGGGGGVQYKQQSPIESSLTAPLANGHHAKCISPPASSTITRTTSPRLTNGNYRGSSVDTKFPLSRESVNPAQHVPSSLSYTSSSSSRRSSVSSASTATTINRKSPSVGSLDLYYEGFGASLPLPPDESILQDAIRNEDDSRKLAHSRASLISEQNMEKSNNNNYEKAHFEMVKNFLRSDDPTARKLTITKRHPVKPTRGRPPFGGGAGSSERKPRPHSISALPSASEADFTELLAGLMYEGDEGGKGSASKSLSSSDDKSTFGSGANSARWEAYLRSRVRASQRFSSVSSPHLHREQEQQNLHPQANGMRNPSPEHLHDDIHYQANRVMESSCCPNCGCPGSCVNNTILMDKMEKALHEMEARMASQMETQTKGLQEHFDRRLNQMFDVVMGKCMNPIYDYVEPSTSAV